MADDELTTEREYLIDYPFQGGRWTFTVVATSWGEAQERLDAIKGWGRVEGEVHGKVPVRPGTRWLTRLRVGLRLGWLRRIGR